MSDSEPYDDGEDEVFDSERSVMKEMAVANVTDSDLRNQLVIAKYCFLR